MIKLAVKLQQNTLAARVSLLLCSDYDFGVRLQSRVQLHGRRLITTGDHAAESKLDEADVVLLGKVICLRLIIHVVYLDTEGLLFLEEVVHLELLYEVGIVVVPDGLRLAQHLLHALVAALFHLVDHTEAVRLGGRVHLRHVSQTDAQHQRGL